MANNKDPNQKQPGEKEPGKFHFNPGNMSGKTVDSCKDESQQRGILFKSRDTVNIGEAGHIECR